MKKILGLLCFAAILAAAYLTVMQFRDEGAPAADVIESEAGEIVDQVKGMYEEYGAPALEQADEALGEAVESAVEGARRGFLESLKESVTSFFDDLTSS